MAKPRFFGARTFMLPYGSHQRPAPSKGWVENDIFVHGMKRNEFVEFQLEALDACGSILWDFLQAVSVDPYYLTQMIEHANLNEKQRRDRERLAAEKFGG